VHLRYIARTSTAVHGSRDQERRPEEEGRRGRDDDDERGAERDKLRRPVVHLGIVLEKVGYRGIDGAMQTLREASVLPIKYTQFFTGTGGNT
jgi:hypothetical protein